MPIFNTKLKLSLGFCTVKSVLFVTKITHSTFKEFIQIFELISAQSVE
jgi:hypothetical protein